MTDWVTITEDKLRAGKASALVDAYANAALGVAQEEPIARKITNACETIRIAIDNGKRTRLSSTPGTIPPSLEDLAVRLICWNLQSRLNVLNSLPMSDQDTQDHKDDLRKLERLEEGKTAVEEPTDPVATPEVPSGGMFETVQEGSSGNSREDLKGL